jgi:AcrR family transcriptional regulator
MAKGLSKQRVIEAALMLIDKGETTVNFRDIARELGCAHTNLYNYFASFDALLWEAQEEIMQRLQSEIEESLVSASTPEEKLSAFFRSFLDFYLAHKGWFTLAWFEPISSPRPSAHYNRAVSTVDALLKSLADISREMNQQIVNTDILRLFLHNVHCYIIGELSIFFSGRSLIQDKALFRVYVNEQAVKMLKSMLEDK